jgi:hypothetical protein
MYGIKRIGVWRDRFIRENHQLFFCAVGYLTWQPGDKGGALEITHKGYGIAFI